MWRLLTVDLVVIGSGIAGMLSYYQHYMRKKRGRVVAHFVGGPLDNREKKIGNYSPVYLHHDINEPGDALYKHDGHGLYIFDEFVEGE